jgi:CRISPR/Cas system-associated exonuclease Cas4 (RecB family)
MSEYYYALGLILVMLYFYIKKKIFMYLLLNKGEILYIDESGSKIYRDVEYGVSSRPDRISRFAKKNIVIEYKSRIKGIFQKDIVQAMVGALASWDSVGGISEVVVYNGSYKYKRVKIKSKKHLYKKISKHIEKARKIKSGETIKCRVLKGNCRVCPFNQKCKWAVKS